MDIIFTRFLPGLREVYKRCCGKLAQPGMSKVPMCLEEFVDMMNAAGLVDDNFGQRQIGPLWNLS